MPSTPARMNITPHLLVDLPCETGEGPLWNDVDQTLTWNDIPAGTLYRYDPAIETNTILYQHDAEIGGHTLQEDGSLLIFAANGRIMQWREGEISTQIESIPAVVGSRFNDVGADPVGRVFCGTMPLPAGSAHLYRLDTDGQLTLVWDDLGLSNGIGFSPDKRTMYLSDSNHRCVYRAEYDVVSGELSNRDVLIDLGDHPGVPDGLTVDASGEIWLAVWDGWGVLHYSAEGEPIEILPMPVRKVSSIQFGGVDLSTAFITTAGGHDRGDEEGILAGSLFSVELPGVRGKQEFRSQVGM